MKMQILYGAHRWKSASKLFRVLFQLSILPACAQCSLFYSFPIQGLANWQNISATASTALLYTFTYTHTLTAIHAFR